LIIEKLQLQTRIEAGDADRRALKEEIEKQEIAMDLIHDVLVGKDSFFRFAWMSMEAIREELSLESEHHIRGIKLDDDIIQVFLTQGRDLHKDFPKDGRNENGEFSPTWHKKKGINHVRVAKLLKIEITHFPQSPFDPNLYLMTDTKRRTSAAAKRPSEANSEFAHDHALAVAEPVHSMSDAGNGAVQGVAGLLLSAPGLPVARGQLLEYAAAPGS